MFKKWIRALALTLTFLMAFGCIACRKVETPSFIKEYLCVEHTYGEGEITRSATCAQEGRIKYECMECGHAKYEAIYSVDHTPYTVEAKSPTCAAPGYKAYTACAECNKALEPIIYIPNSREECKTEDEYYVGAGVSKCSLCGKSKTEYSGLDVINKSGSLENFSMGAWYRFYYPKEDSVALLTFTCYTAEYFGEIKPHGGIPIEVREISIGIKGKEPAVVFYGDRAYQVDLEMRASGSDYVDIFIDDSIVSGVAVTDNTEGIEFSLDLDKIDLQRAKVTLRNFGRIVRLPE